MADPIVAPDVCRYTVHQTMGGRQIANVIDLVVLDQSGGTFDRNDAIHAAAGDVLDAWDQYIRGGQSTDLSCESVSYVDLNSADGRTGIVSTTADTTWPSTGGAAGERLPSNVSLLVTKQTASSRGSRNGRMYVAGLTEQFVNGSNVTGSFFSVLVGDYGNFTEALTETGVVSVYSTFPTVVHTRNVGTSSNPVIEYVNNTQITSFAPQQLLATQRRRLRG